MLHSTSSEPELFDAARHQRTQGGTYLLASHDRWDPPISVAFWFREMGPRLFQGNLSVGEILSMWPDFYPYHPCKVSLPTFGGFFMVNVGKYTIYSNFFAGVVFRSPLSLVRFVEYPSDVIPDL